MTGVHPPMGAVREAVARALAEDIGALGDLTSALLPPQAVVTADLVPRAEGVLAGRRAATETVAQVDPLVKVHWRADDGQRVTAGQPIATMDGPLSAILMAERTALNFLCHLSGIATLTRRYADAAAPRAFVRDTRKTTPGLRALEKAAVRAGGGLNHRASLSDGILVKDNHLAGISIEAAVAKARVLYPGRPVQVECDSLRQAQVAATVGADLLLLDNMAPDDVARCVTALRQAGYSGTVEVSGGVTLENVPAYAAAGAQLISVGALTHSAPILDIGLDIGRRPRRRRRPGPRLTCSSPSTPATPRPSSACTTGPSCSTRGASPPTPSAPPTSTSCSSSSSCPSGARGWPTSPGWCSRRPSPGSPPSCGRWPPATSSSLRSCSSRAPAAGMPILYDNPRQVGPDRIANAVGAFDLYGGPTLVVDFGTATTIDATSAAGEYLGGAILPGIEISLDALFDRAAALSWVELVPPRRVIGKNTPESIQSGVLFGFAAAVDGLCRRFEAELGTCMIVSTGGLGGLMAPLSECIQRHDPWLTLHGLRLIYELNK